MLINNMSADNDSVDRGLDSYRSTSDESVSSSDINTKLNRPRRRFTNAQTSCLLSHYDTGMKGTGKEYKSIIDKASKDTGLTPAQVKV